MVKCLPWFILVCCVVSTEAAISFSLGECPDGHKTGETWTHHGNDCSRCTCYDNGYECQTCGVIHFHIARHPDCYIEDHQEDSYPKCCLKYPVCKGEKGFNQAKYDLFVQQFGRRSSQVRS